MDIRVLIKRCLFVAFVAVLSGAVQAQLTIGECYRLARENYPLVRRYELLEHTEQFNMENARKAFLPQLSFSAQASWQSDVTTIPFEIPGITFDGMERDQYQIVLELRQMIYDGGGVRARREAVKAQSLAERQQTEVDLYALYGKVNELYFGILLYNARLEQAVLLREQLERNLKQVEACLRRGVVGKADVDAVRVEQINARQTELSVGAARKAYCEVLALLLGKDSVEPEDLVLPDSLPMAAAGVTQQFSVQGQRPEIRLFEAQEAQIEAQRHTLYSGLRPTLGLFMQGGYGDPGLNMLKGGFTPYYMGGIRLNWNISGLYTLRNDRRVFDEQQRQIDVARSTFLFNNHLEQRQAFREVERLRALMKEDDELIRLRGNIREAAEAKLEKGTITVTDLLGEVTAESNARLARALRLVELRRAEYELLRVGGGVSAGETTQNVDP